LHKLLDYLKSENFLFKNNVIYSDCHYSVCLCWSIRKSCLSNCLRH